MRTLVLVLFAALLVAPASAEVTAGNSVCFGTTSAGALAAGCKMPSGGDNFEAYSGLGRLLGRTYAHCDVTGVVAAAYSQLASSQPDKRFMYGETGFEAGGPFRPHKTHQNGLSIDFFVPVLDERGRSVSFPAGITNKFGYSVEFDRRGRYKKLSIDFEAMAAHIAAIRVAADRQGVGIWRVIFDPELQPFLRETAAWAEIQDLSFSKRRSWVRHDEHYHIDFQVPCRPLSEWPG